MKPISKINVLLIVLFVAVGCQSLKKDNSQKGLPDWAMGRFVRPNNLNPIISPQKTTFMGDLEEDSIGWESGNTFNPAATVMNNSVYVLYRAEDQSGQGIGGHTSRIGLAKSNNGVSISKRFKEPVLYPQDDNQKQNEWPGGTEDPRVAVTKNGTYLMLYTQWNRKVPRLAVATSTDLQHWTKHGPAFEDAYNGKFSDRATKSASIVTKLVGNRKVIAKVNGRYFMYWGEKHIYAATSDNLTDWKPLVDKRGDLQVLASPRDGYFDSALTECGPPAIITKDGILLLYNGKNKAGAEGDTTYTANTYSAGQILFDSENPTNVLKRLDKPFLVPTASFEKSGQYPDGTVFIEGLVFFKHKWYLYYGCADSRVAVAVYNPQNK